MNERLLEIQNLNISFRFGSELRPAVRHVSLDIEPGESIALVGESGCGKSVTALSILRLLSPRNAEIQADSMKLGELELMALDEAQIRNLRGNKVSMIFQEPMTSLNPLLPVGFQVAEVLRLHQKKSRSEAKQEAIELMRKMEIPDPEACCRKYPHQLSGGMRQRVMIASALACQPCLLVADEPTTALDVTTQAQILRLISRQQRELKMAVLLITHDLGIVAQMADRVFLMYAGQIVETAPVKELFENPGHPYTEALLRSIPSGEEEREYLPAIAGSVPSPGSYPSGCRFHPRCPYAQEQCRLTEPPLKSVNSKHLLFCHFPIKKRVQHE